MRISGSFIMMLIVWALAFTHFLGGPYFLFKVIFWIALLPYIITTAFFLLLLFKAKKFFRFSRTINNSQNQNQETIHVEATIKE